MLYIYILQVEYIQLTLIIFTNNPIFLMDALRAISVLAI